MKRTLAISIVAVAAAAVGCVPSMQPSFTDKDLTFDPQVVGFFQQEKSAATWDFTKTGNKEYQLVYTDDRGRSGRFVGHLAAFGGAKFLDLYPVKDDVQANEFYKFHLLPIHTTYMVQETTPHLKLAGFDMGWLNEYLTANPDAIANTTFDSQHLVTAPTPELQAFLLEHQDHFTVVFSLKRVEK
jgi:hypothetical protein